MLAVLSAPCSSPSVFAVNHMVAYPGLGSYAQAGGLPSRTALASEAGGTGQW